MSQLIAATEYELAIVMPCTAEQREEANLLMATHRADRGHEELPLETIETPECLMLRYRVP
jgi:hypothetical protein